MVLPRSRQRLVLERVAVQYFLRDTRRRARYVGVTDCGDGVDDDGWGNVGESFDRDMGSGTWGAKGRPGAPLGLVNKDREAVISFLGGDNLRGVDDEYVGADEGTNLGFTTEATLSTCDEKSAPRSDHRHLRTSRGKPILTASSRLRATTYRWAEMSLPSRLIVVR
jgi:hypothetical protein